MSERPEHALYFTIGEQHGYPLRGDQDAYIREHDAARAAQRVRWAVAPQCQYTTPLGRVLGAGQEITINECVGGDEPAHRLLEKAVLSGIVIQAINRFANLPIPLPTLVVDNGKVIVDPDPDVGWVLNPMANMSEAISHAWLDECRAASARAKVAYVVAPNARLRLRDRSLLVPGDEVKRSHFRCSEERGSIRGQLQRLVDCWLVLEADNRELVERHESRDDEPQEAA